MDNTIKRSLFSDIRAHLSCKEMTLVVGPRQAGKTTLLKLLEVDVQKDGQKTVFLNFDIEADQQHLISPHTANKRKCRNHSHDTGTSTTNGTTTTSPRTPATNQPPP